MTITTTRNVGDTIYIWKKDVEKLRRVRITEVHINCKAGEETNELYSVEGYSEWYVARDVFDTAEEFIHDALSDIYEEDAERSSDQAA